jgi:hypothetical protein
MTCEIMFSEQKGVIYVVYVIVYVCYGVMILKEVIKFQIFSSLPAGIRRRVIILFKLQSAPEAYVWFYLCCVAVYSFFGCVLLQHVLGCIYAYADSCMTSTRTQTNVVDDDSCSHKKSWQQIVDVKQAMSFNE